MDRAMGEILGRESGACAGKGGSMHIADASVGALGSFAIVGANLPVTVGAALSAKLQRTRGVSVAFFGDGSTNIGAFHEALNLAAVWKLPAIFVCENNLYGEYSPIAATTAVERIADRAGAYAMPGERVDGNDVLAVRSTTERAVERARSGEGPTLIEALTYRHLGHSRSDPATYRPADEVECWLARDPLIVFRECVLRLDLVSETELDDAYAAAKQSVDDATERALAWPAPSLDSRFRDVYA
jgi:pyruvate dehydrogenase E1 component alpha subunit